MQRNQQKEDEIKKDLKNLISKIANYYDIDNKSDIYNSGERISKMLFEELTKGYYENPDKYLKYFDAELESTPLIIQDIPVKSLCEHHLLPMYGTATIVLKYKENAKVLGLSKFYRIVDNFARKFQLQERLTNEIANYFAEKLEIDGLIVELNCDHFCVKMRGVNSEVGKTKSICARGCYKDNYLSVLSGIRRG